MHKAKHPSSLLMNRIKEVYTGFININALAQKEWQSQAGARFKSYQPLPTKQIIAVAVKGKSHRKGPCGVHATTGKTKKNANHLKSYVQHLIKPVKQNGFQVLCFKDLHRATYCANQWPCRNLPRRPVLQIRLDPCARS